MRPDDFFRIGGNGWVGGDDQSGFGWDSSTPISEDLKNIGGGKPNTDLPGCGWQRVRGDF